MENRTLVPQLLGWGGFLTSAKSAARRTRSKEAHRQAIFYYRKFSAVLGQTSARNSISIRPAFWPSMAMSKKTLGFGILLWFFFLSLVAEQMKAGREGGNNIRQCASRPAIPVLPLPHRQSGKNGQVSVEVRYHISTTLSSRVDRFNPPWNSFNPRLKITRSENPCFFLSLVHGKINSSISRER